jgi:hypothetical protein
MKTYEKWRYGATILDVGNNGGGLSASGPADLPPGREHPRAHFTGHWEGPRASLAAVEKQKTIAPTKNRFLDRAALSLVVIPTEPSCLPLSIKHHVTSTGKMQMFYTKGLSEKMRPGFPQFCP